MKTIQKRVETSTSVLTQGTLFQEWLKQEKPVPGSNLLINNSFVYRDKLQTTKSQYYPAIFIDSKGGLNASDVNIAAGPGINSDFKAFPPKALGSLKSESLKSGITRECLQLGHLVFLLIGEVQDTAVNTEDIGSALFNKIRLDPAAVPVLSINGREITVNSVADDEALWAYLEKEHGNALPEEFLQPFATAIKNLRARDHALLRVPPRTAKLGKTLIDSWADALTSSTAEYSKALKDSGGTSAKDPDAFNSVLRIAYNFAGDAIHLIRLLISICDAKPVVQWCTSNDWLRLSEAFRLLPWSKLKGKPSLDGYQQTINSARNRAFHNLLMVNKTLQAEVAGSALGTIKLRLFSEYTRRTEEKFDYKDKVLVQILTDFTRAAEQSVSPTFWNRNLSVMEATVALIKSISDTLKDLHKEYGPGR